MPEGIKERIGDALGAPDRRVEGDLERPPGATGGGGRLAEKMMLMAEPIDIASARDAVLGAAGPLGAEEVALQEALGRVLAEAVASDEDLPPFDSSAMDGYAVPAGAAAALRVVGEARAGRPTDRRPGHGEAIAISTGAQMPPGRDLSVVPVERIRRSGEDEVEVPATAAGANVRRAGEDVRVGETVMAPGAVLGPAELAVAASLGRSRLACGRRPAVAIVVTGDELAKVGAPLGPGQIRNSNAVALVAQASAAGARVVQDQLVPDDHEATVAALSTALDAADVVCVSGGVSVGAHDHVRPALEVLGVAESFWGVRLKPGKPTWFGTRGAKLVFGLPGNPVSAMVTFHLFARPALRRLAGADPEETRTRARLDAPLERHPRREQAIRCRIHLREDGWHLSPRPEQGSHVLTSMLGAGALALVPQGTGVVPAGELMDAELLPARWGDCR